MTDAKLEFRLGTLEFAGEGDQTWLASQLDKILDAAPKLSLMTTPEGPEQRGGTQDDTSEEFKETLASYIKTKGGESNQVQRFLATADWLRRRGGKTLTTSAVTKALAENQQKRLSNPADSLNKNVAKGFCEKQGDGFFITSDGLRALGHNV